MKSPLKLLDLNLSRLIPGPAEEVFDVWFDPKCPGGPWHGAEKALMNFVVDGMFYFGVNRAEARQKIPDLPDVAGLMGHFGRFTAIERARSVEHTWMSEHTQGIETTVHVTFEPRDGGTLLTIHHRGIPDTENARGHERGWNFLLGRTADHFGGRA